MNRELDKKEGTSVQHKKETGQRGKSRSRAAFKERKDRQAKARSDEDPGRQRPVWGRAATVCLVAEAEICVGGYIYHAEG